MRFVIRCDKQRYLYHQILQKVMAEWQSKNKSISLKLLMAPLWSYTANYNSLLTLVISLMKSSHKSNRLYLIHQS